MHYMCISWCANQMFSACLWQRLFIVFLINYSFRAVYLICHFGIFFAPVFMKDCHSFYNVSVHAMKAYVGLEMYFHLFVTSVLEDSEWST